MAEIMKNEDLTEVQQYRHDLASEFAEELSNQMIPMLQEIIKNDENFKGINYQELVTFLMNVNSEIFCRLFDFIHFMCKTMPNYKECCSETLFEENINGTQLMMKAAISLEKEKQEGIH